DPKEIYTLYDYTKDFEKVYRQLSERNVLPVLTGGTGLYIEAVLKDYDIQSVPEDPQLRERLTKNDKEFLIGQLKDIDPEIYRRTDCSSKKRVIRALEIAFFKRENPGISLEEKRLLQLNPCVLCVKWDRAELRERIDNRLEQRLKQGMVEEVKRLLASGIAEDRFALFGMEYKYVARYVKKQVLYKTMVKELQTSIHQLAKRQETWFRGMERRGIEVHWVRNADFQEAIAVADRCFG
ncbi:MAG: tRNA (adenosine(37)-N6)-dimethylallyltransferase MiaA, partial [Fibrobacter sp.]|nr:tRNA (adenosine(37)-N6)-dimethylallyltransferase MiaA [Fibrobacter sp.]